MDASWVSRRSFADWIAGYKPLAITSSPDTGYSYLNVGGKDANVQLQKTFGITSRIDRLDHFSTAKVTLFSGDAERGIRFVGAPGLGSVASDALTDRYLVQLSRDGGTYQAGAVLKYDRLTQTVTVVPLGTSAGHYPFGRPIRLSNGRLLQTTRGAEIDKFVFGSRAGVYTIDPRDQGSMVTHTSVTSTDTQSWNGNPAKAASGMPAEFVQLPSGRIFAQAPEGFQRGEVFMEMDSVTGAPIPASIFRMNVTTRVDSLPYRIAANRGNTVVVTLPADEADAIAFGVNAESLVCAVEGPGRLETWQRSKVGLGPDYSANGNAHHVVRGPTYHPGTDKLYVATSQVARVAEGRIHALDVSSCGTSMTLTTRGHWSDGAAEHEVLCRLGRVAVLRYGQWQVDELQPGNQRCGLSPRYGGIHGIQHSRWLLGGRATWRTHGGSEG